MHKYTTQYMDKNWTKFVGHFFKCTLDSTKLLVRVVDLRDTLEYGTKYSDLATAASSPELIELYAEYSVIKPSEFSPKIAICLPNDLVLKPYTPFNKEQKRILKRLGVWRLVKSHIKYAEMSNMENLTLKQAFVWKDTPEGFLFWDAINTTIQNIINKEK